jgi:chemotaxis protein MotB
MSLDEGLKHQEIIIVRRGGHDEDEGHHGGVWKIAFADFMTAMMCFFLVMWLINAANEQTKAALASYFNPVKLIDRNTSRKGIDDPAKTPGDPDTSADKDTHEEEKPVAAREAVTGPAKQENSRDESNTRRHSDKNLFANPYSVLAEIAGETGTLQNTSAKGDGGARDSGPATGASGGQTYRDPFAPNFWSQQVDMPKEAAETASAGLADNFTSVGGKVTTSESKQVATARMPASGEAEAGDKVKPGAAQQGSTAAGTTASEQTGPAIGAGLARAEAKATPATAASQAAAEVEAQAAAERNALKPDEAGVQKTTDQAGPATEPGAARAGAEAPERKPAPGEAEKSGKAKEKLAADIRNQLAGSFGSDDPVYKGLTVTETDRGVLISVSDQSNFGMFEIGSAVPNRETVLAMEKISKILGTHKGAIRIDGHTDGRPFKSDTYDNWRLSSARAQTAYYMLVRAGLDEKRVLEVAGFADRKLKVKGDPYADANRRIEILLETQ